MIRRAKSPLRNSITIQILKITFAIYFVVTLTVTLIHMKEEYRYVKQVVIKEMRAMQETFEPVIAQALWRLDQRQWESTIDGMMKSPIVVGIKLQDEAKPIYIRGTVLSEEEKIVTEMLPGNSNTTNENFLISTNLFAHNFSMNYANEQVGKITLYSSGAVIFNKVKVGFFYIIMNAVIKTIALWCFFLWAGQRLLNRPISALITEIEQLNLENLEGAKIDIKIKDQNELKILEETFNSMISKLHLSIMERKQIEDSLRESEERYRAIIEDSPNLICRFIPSMEITFVNEEYCKYFDIPYEELVGKNFLTLIPEEDRDFVKTNILALNSDSPIQSHEHKVVSKNNELRWQQWTNRALFDEEGEIIAYQSIGRDITDRKQAEQQIEASLREKEVLLSEIHHRVKNNMQVVTSLLKLQAENIKDKKYADMFKESQDRIKSMALVHEKLYQTKSFADIDLKGYVKSLVTNLFRSYGTKPDKITLRIEVENVSLGLESAIPCGLIINELVSNSMKYAFPEEREGEIRVALNSINKEETLLEVSDNGVGMPEELDIRNTESMGLHLVTILSENQLEGKIELSRVDGTKFYIKFKKHEYKARV